MATTECRICGGEGWYEVRDQAVDGGIDRVACGCNPNQDPAPNIWPECPVCGGVGFYPGVDMADREIATACRYCQQTEPCPTCGDCGHIPGPWGEVDCTGCDGGGLVSPWRRDVILGARAA